MRDDLKRAIDRMVEDAIRRILPSVMNEVLVATIARGAVGIVTEGRPAAGKATKPPRRKKKPRHTRDQREPRIDPRPPDLSSLLDRSVGAEFYQDPGSIGHDDEDPRETTNSRITSRIESLPPSLRGLAEDIDMDGDEGEMWQPGELDSNSSDALSPSAPEIRNINEAASRVGVDFNRMRAVIGATTQVRKVDRDDVRANAQFEQSRLKRMRERLNDGKPVE